jgi:hypothetical protein
MDAEDHSPYQDFKLEDIFTLEDIVSYIEFITLSEHLIMTVKQLDELKKLPPELQAAWRRFEVYLDSPSLGAVPREAIQGVSGAEPSEDSQPPPGETRSDRTTDLPPAASAVLTDQTTGAEAAAPAASAGSEFFCCVLAAAGHSTIRITYDAYRIIAHAHCKDRQMKLHPHRTMSLHDGTC